MIGKKISHYNVTEKLGAGGMGEVYRATDTKLNRDVALKVLPEVFANDAQRMARFSREAQVLASLNHPNIASIYGLEESGGVRCLVLELVEGPTLAERIAAGPLPTEEALNIARQIAEALEAAHEKGIIHRDLKPANVKVTPEGTVKVLDFGLAKALEDDPSSIDISESPTLSVAATQAGVILGTAAYMSPEQARGQAVDKRADIWSFGVVLYEMLTGKRTFSGETISDTLAAVLRAEVDWVALPADTPASIRKLLRRCLDKDRKRRLHAIGEARIAIEEYLADPAAASVLISTPTVAPQPLWQRALPWAVAGVFALAFVVSLWSPWSSPTPPSPLRLEVKVSPDEPLFTGTGAAAVLSPDGKTLAYVAESGGTRRLYLRPLDQLEATLLSGTEGARDPFFSPDGRWVAFFTDNALKKVSVTGGAPLTLCETQINRGGTWGPDDTIVFASHTSAGLSRIPATGGTPEEITTRSEGELSHRWPHFLPNGKAVLFTQDQGATYDDATIEALVLRTGERKVLHEGGTYPRYLPSGSTGHLVYVREATLFAAPFDPDRVEVTGQPAPVLEGVASLGAPANGGAQYAFSPTGTLVYLAGAASSSVYSLVRADRSGKATPLSDDQRFYGYPRLSPDGRRVALRVGEAASWDIWVYETERGTMSRLTFQGNSNDSPTWTPDGQRIAFSSDRDGGAPNIYWKRADGAGAAERLTTSKNRQSPWSFSPDGKRLAFHENSPETVQDLWVLPLEGERKPELFLATPSLECAPSFPPAAAGLPTGRTNRGAWKSMSGPIPAPGASLPRQASGKFRPTAASFRAGRRTGAS